MIRILLAASLVLGGAQAAPSQDDGHHGRLHAVAIAHLHGIQAMSIAANAEFCGYIGRAADGQLAPLPPARGARDSCDPTELPAGFEVLASYHTHGGYSVSADTEVPSPADLRGDITDGINGYVATPGGRVWLTIHTEAIAVQLCGPGCIAADADFLECPARVPEQSYTLEALERRARDGPGSC